MPNYAYSVGDPLPAHSGQHHVPAASGHYSLSSGQHSIPSGQHISQENPPTSSGQHSLLSGHQSFPSGHHSLPRSGRSSHTSPIHNLAGNSSGDPLPTSQSRRANPLRLSREPASTSGKGYMQSRGKAMGSHDRHMTSPTGGGGGALMMDPFLPPNQQQSYQGTSPRREAWQQATTSTDATAWCTFGETPPTSRNTTTAESSFMPISGSSSRGKLALKRYSSTGAFSDDFVLKGSSKDSSNGVAASNLARSTQHFSPTHQRLYASTEHLSHLGRHRNTKFGRSAELLTTQSTFATSEGDLKALQDFRYQRLVHSPNVASSQDNSPAAIRRRGGADTEQLLCHSSPEPENTENIQRSPEQYPGQNTENIQRSPEQYPGQNSEGIQRNPEQSPGSSEQANGGTSNSDGTSSLGRLGNLSSDLFQQFPMLRTDTSASTLIDTEESHDHIPTKAEPVTPDLTPVNTPGGVAGAEGGTGQRQEALSPDRGVHLSSSPALQPSLDVFPKALDSEVDLLGGLGSPDPQVEGAGNSDDVLNSERSSSKPPTTGTSSPDAILGCGPAIVNQASNEIQSPVSNLEDFLSPSHSSATATPPHNPVTLTGGGTRTGGHAYENVVMSPIPEASQELTSSMSQPNDATIPSSHTHHQSNNRLSGSHFQFASGLSGTAPSAGLSSGTTGLSSGTGGLNSGTVGLSGGTGGFSSGTVGLSGGTGGFSSGTVGLSGGTGGFSSGTGSGTVGLSSGNSGTVGLSSGNSGTVGLSSGMASSAGSSMPSAASSDAQQSSATLPSGCSDERGDGEESRQDGTRAGRTGVMLMSAESAPWSAVPSGTERGDHMTSTSRSHDQHRPDHMTNSDVSTASSIRAQVGDGASRDGCGQNASSSPRRRASAPPPLKIESSSVGGSRDMTRPLSPLATTAFSVNNTMVTTQQQQDPVLTTPPQQGGSGTQTHPAHRYGEESTLAVVPRPHSRTSVGGAGGRAYSQQRQQQQDGAKIQHRISQDLEMMNLAISGMDSGSCSQPVYAQSRAGGGVAGGGGGGRAHRTPSSDHNLTIRGGNQFSSSSTQQQAHPRNAPSQHSRHHTATSSQATPTNAVSAASNAPSGTSGSHNTSQASAATFRPITPALLSGQQQQQRCSSAPSNRNVGPPTLAPPPVVQAQTASRQHQPASREATPNGHHHHGNHHHRGGGGGRGDHVMVVQPPQVTADSYDYLPPYSPPSSSTGAPAPFTRSQMHQQLLAQHNQRQQWAYATPITGEPPQGGYAEPPPSYNEIFGRMSGVSESQQQQQSRGERHRSRDSSSLGRNQSNQSDSRASPRQQGRLTSFTNLFRRARRHASQEGGDRSATPEVGAGVLGAVDDYTAQWVESYSHTPRPHTLSAVSAQHHPPPPPSSVGAPSTPVSARSHQTRHTFAPIPQYRDPPPLTPVENRPPQQQQGSLLVAGGRDSGGRGSHSGRLNLSLSRLPVEGTGSAGGSPRGRSHDRPRPVSAYFPLESHHTVHHPRGNPHHQLINTARTATPTQIGSTHSTPRQQHSRLPGNPASPLSASCSNIASTEVVAKKPKQPSRSKLRRRSSGRSFALPPQAAATNQERASSSQSSRQVSGGGRSRGLEGEGGVVNTSQQGTTENLAPTTAALKGEEPSLVANGNTNSHAHSNSSNSQASVLATVGSTSPPITVDHAHQNASNVSSHVNINALSGSSALSQITPDAVSGSNANLSTSNLRSSANSASELSVANSTSSRTAARLRAENRRESLATSSEDDDIITDQSHRHHHHHRGGGRGRPKRQRSQGSGSYIGGHRSQESVNRIEGELVEEGVSLGGGVEGQGGSRPVGEEGVAPPSTSPEARESSRGSLDSQQPPPPPPVSSALPSGVQERPIGEHYKEFEVQ